MRRRMQFRLLEILVETAEAGGVSQGAQRLNLSRAAVSMSISRLELMLGTKLFAANRSELTQEGHALVAKVGDNVRSMRELLLRLEADAIAGPGELEPDEAESAGS